MDPEPDAAAAGDDPKAALLAAAAELQRRRDMERAYLSKTALKKTRRKLSRLYHRVRGSLPKNPPLHGPPC